jgi:hypothetical protein
VVRYTNPGQTITWRDESDEVVVDLGDLFGDAPKPKSAADEPVEFETFNATELARLRRFETPWTIGYTPQWFTSSISDLLLRFKDEVWEGVLFGPECDRDALLSAMFANVGLWEVLPLAPLELWQQALT